MILFHPHFKKHYTKLTKKIRDKVDTVISLFQENPFDQKLHNHPLHGDWDGYRSIDVTGDIRLVYKQSEEHVIFVKVGTHSQLYK